MTEGTKQVSHQAEHASESGPDRTRWTSTWRASYRPGDWLVLTGPTSLVVMQPAAPQWSELINAVWEDVLASASLEEIAERLAGFRLDAMPDFGALFWEGGRMRSLVRGRVAVIDPDTGRVVATGEGIRTWSETGLGSLERVQLQLGEPVAEDEPALELPLVIGAVTASVVVLDAGTDAQVSSPQGGAAAAQAAAAEAAPERAAEPEPEEPSDAGRQPEHAAADDRYAMENESTLMGQPPVPPVPAAASVDEPAPEGAAAATSQPATAGGSDADDDAQTIFASSLPGLSGDRADGPQQLGVLRPSSGGEIAIDRPVVIGRSPVASRVAGPQLPRVLTVPSPSNDISRTHLKVEPDNGRVVVTDLESTNGTVLVRPDGTRSKLDAGVAVPVEYGSIIDLGDGVTISVDQT